MWVFFGSEITVGSVFRVGDRVWHKNFGLGTVEVAGEEASSIRFDDLNDVKKIINGYLVLEKSRTETSGSGLKVWPSTFDRRDYFTKSEKEIIRFCQKRLTVGQLVMGVHPVGQGQENRIGFCVLPEGIFAFQINDADTVSLANMEIVELFRKTLEDKLYQRLLDAKRLIVRKGNKKILKVPFTFAIVFQNVRVSQVSELSYEQWKKQCRAKIFFRNFTFPGKGNTTVSDADKLKKYWFDELYLPYAEDFIQLGTEETTAIIERLAPEYAIIFPTKQQVDVPATSSSVVASEEITGNEHEFLTFCFDDKQVDIVNHIRKGHQLILANAGAGKSVLLLAKSYRLADIYPEDKILLTCFNANLADSYQFRAEMAGFGSKRNLFISTFHKFVIDFIFDHTGFEYKFDQIDQAVADLERLVLAGEIKTRFRGIFIDEVQIFQPSWIDICYMLLAEPKDRSFLVIAGDLNQDVRNLSRRRKAVWQLADQIPSPGFRGRVLYIRKNYRNTMQICTYLNRMLTHLQQRAVELGLEDDDEYRNVINGETTKSGPEPVIKVGISRLDITKQIVDTIRYIHASCGVPYQEIAVIFPYKRFKKLRYHPLFWIKNSLDDLGIPYTVITQERGEYRTTVTAARGVILSTVESSLGLDFKAVIVAGLFPLDYMFTKNGLTYLENWQTFLEGTEQVRGYYVTTAKKLYTACSRAREYLYILSDLGESSAFHELIVSGGKKDG